MQRAPGKAEQSLSLRLLPTDMLACGAGSLSPPLPVAPQPQVLSQQVPGCSPAGPGVQGREGTRGVLVAPGKARPTPHPPLGVLRMFLAARKLPFFVSSKEKMIYEALLRCAAVR